MKKLTAIAALPLCAGFLFAQSQSQSQSTQRETKTETTTTTKSSTWNGTLVDASCRTTHSAHRESTETSKDADTTKTTRTTSSESKTECPVTTTTSSFGLMTSDGKYIPFDEASNAKVVQVMKSNQDWGKNVESKKPVSVTVVGNQRGDTIVIESIK